MTNRPNFVAIPTVVQAFATTDALVALRSNAPIVGPISALQTLIGSSGGSSGGTTPSAATTYTISTALTGTAGTAQIVTITTTGTLSSNVVVTLSDGAGGTFSGTVMLAAGTNSSGTTQYTPASAGTRTLVGTNNGGLTNPGGPSVTVAAASSGGGGSSSARPALTLTTPVFETANPIYGAKSFKGGSGTTTIAIPVNANGSNQGSVAIRGTIILAPGPRGDGAILTMTSGITTALRINGNNNASGNASALSASTAGSGYTATNIAVCDGNKHTFNLTCHSDYGQYNYSTLYVDQSLVKVTDGANGVFTAGNATFTLNWQNMIAGDMIDNIEITVTDHTTGTSTTTPITADSGTLALYDFDAGTGVSS